MSEPLLILGASTRAAVASALRAGLTPDAADLFCDDDLRQMVEQAKRVKQYPDELPSLARTYPPGPWMFTGALENHPTIIDVISAERELWGTTADSTRQVRDPWQLADCLRQNTLLYPEILRADQGETIDRESRAHWIVKPFRSAGGGNIRLWTAGENTHDRPELDRPPGFQSPKYYLQQHVDGEPQSAVFVAAKGAAVLLGVTQQLIGREWAGATGFRYAGSIGPLQPSGPERSQWHQIGRCLASKFDLQGLFGVDAIVNDLGIWTIEVNPRYTSSIEILEYGFEIQALHDHVVACRDHRLPERSTAPRAKLRGKAVIYARRDVPIDSTFVQAARQANSGHAWPMIADIPSAGQVICTGHPIATVYATSDILAEVEPRLKDTVQSWQSKWNL